MISREILANSSFEDKDRPGWKTDIRLVHPRSTQNTSSLQFERANKRDRKSSVSHIRGAAAVGHKR